MTEPSEKARGFGKGANVVAQRKRFALDRLRRIANDPASREFGTSRWAHIDIVALDAYISTLETDNASLRADAARLDKLVLRVQSLKEYHFITIGNDRDPMYSPIRYIAVPGTRDGQWLRYSGDTLRSAIDSLPDPTTNNQPITSNGSD